MDDPRIFKETNIQGNAYFSLVVKAFVANFSYSS